MAATTLPTHNAAVY